MSLAAVVPELIVALHEAATAGEWEQARRLHDRVYPLSVAIYRRHPGNRATARLKACLKLLGRIPSATARPPICELPHDEIRELGNALKIADFKPTPSIGKAAL